MNQPETANGFEAFAAANAGFFADLAYLVSGSRSRSREITAEAWVAIFRSWPRLEHSRQRRVAATAIVIDILIRHSRRMKSVDAGGLQLQDHRTIAAGTVLSRRPDEDPVWEALADLPTRQRAVVVLRCFANLTGPEIGRAMRWRTPRPAATLAKALRELMLTVAPKRADSGHDPDPLITFERRVRTSLQQRVEPDGDAQPIMHTMPGQLDGVRQRSRHSPVLLLGSALLVTAFVAGAVQFATGGSSSPQARGAVPQTPAAPAGTRLVGYGEMAVAVPTSWGHNLTACGGDSGDTVIYPDAAPSDGCLLRGDSSSVSFSDPLTSLVPLGRAAHEVDRIAGQRVFEAALLQPGGVSQRMVIVPGAGFQMVVRSRDVSVIDDIVASLSAVPEGYTVVPVCERLLLRDAAGRLKDAKLRLRLTQSSDLSQRHGQPPVTHQSVASGTIVPTGTTIGIGFPSADE